MIHEIASVPRPGCPACGAGGDVLYVLEDHLFGTSGSWPMRRCRQDACGTLWLDPAPAPDALYLAYVDYYTHGGGQSLKAPVERQGAALRGMYRQAQDLYVARRYGYPALNVGWKARTVARLIAGWPGRRADADFSIFYLPSNRRGRILDLGCGSGEAVAALARMGWDAQGVDVDPVAVTRAREAGLRVQEGDVLSCPFPDAAFDAVTSSHVIEHVPDPRRLLSEAFRLLRPGGFAIFITPNVESTLHRRYNAAWLGLDPPRHLQLFRRPVLESLFAAAGFTVKRSFTSVRAANVGAAASRAFARRQRFDMTSPVRGLGRLRAEVEQQLQAIFLKLRPDAGEEIVVVAERP